ncbi:MAG: hypothetical protein US11_C0004G0071 [Candidatus Roizmanbacteria bacterium GW2011_GWA2_36_23]|uniref:Big-1 domain-containing protein n=1 Tax=Candidatus Roizmanbacteria bacterium GW2011_GWA2_36_23 TaxID=1618480 RepID=A0A0G0HD15_9BACT|nr:MAG: hypothetical protein US11_C0004G0071 [Candidatus Roizmanbacteria bacterium GW2011_GWA2_36_23]
MLLFMLTFGLFTTITVFNKPLTRLTKAKEEFLPSSDSTLIFAWPLSVKISEGTKVQINVFVRNMNNIPLPNKTVTLNSTLGKISENNIITDKAGKAVFTLKPSVPGIAEISATVDNQVQVKQKITVKIE